MAKETRKLNMHSKLLYDVIMRQAGTLAKALLEAVMNSSDAKATQCRITYKPGTRTVVIDDDGSGILKKEHIEQWFETFGQPHEESEKKIFGTFRMGRGQLFAFGVNNWRTGPWEMEVDVKNRGLEYDLTKHKEQEPGCRITMTLYEEQLPSEYQETVECLKNWVKFSPIPVLLNGQEISWPDKKIKWDYETEDAYIKLNSNGVMAVYNLGIHALNMDSWRFGTGGIVVSKKQLKVNFARNDVQHDCPVWKKITPFLQQKAKEANLRKPLLDEAGRRSLIRQFLSREIAYDDIRNSKLITTVAGRHFTISEMWNAYGFHRRLTTCAANSSLGDDIMNRKIAMVITDVTLDRFGVETLPELLTLLKRYLPDHFAEPAAVVDFATLTKGLDKELYIVPGNEWSNHEKIWIELARNMYTRLRAGDGNDDGDTAIGSWGRTITLGSGEALGWTDGSTYIAISRKLLKQHAFNLAGVTALALVIIHEMCHGDPSTAEHNHGAEFYEKFHDESQRKLAGVVSFGLVKLSNIVEKSAKKQSKSLLQSLDSNARVAKATEKLNANR